VGSRTPSNAIPFAGALGARVFQNETDMLAAKPDLVIVSIPDPAKTQMAERLVAQGVAIFLETPFGTNVSNSKRLLDLILTTHGLVEVASNQSFSPYSELQKEILRSGCLGKIIGVQNHFLEYYYHATTRFVVQVPGSEHTLSRCTARNTSLSLGGKLEYRRIEMDSGIFFEHFYTSPKDHAARTTKNWIVICEKGSISHTEMKRVDDRLCAEVAGRIFEVPYPQSLGTGTKSENYYGLEKLLRRQIDVIAGREKNLLLGPALAHQGVHLWRSMEASRYFGGIPVSQKWIELVEFGRSFLRS
jgi:predicted dehydrogenase